MNSSPSDPTEPFLSGGGEMARFIAAHDWSGSLGPVANWPGSLKTTVGLMLHSPVPLVLLWGTDGIMIYNDAYSVFAGARHPRLLGSKVREGWPEVAAWNDNVMKVGLAGATLSYREQELVLDRRGQLEPCWLNLDYSPVIDESGKPGGVIAIVVEITEQVQVARELAESERRLQTALSAGRGIGTWDWDVSSDKVVADERFATLYGVDPDRARSGAPLGAFFGAMHRDDSMRVMAEVKEAIVTGKRFNSTYRLVRPDGSVRWVEAEGQCIMDAQGRPQRFPGVTFDVTERVEALAAMRESESRYRSLFESIDAGFCIFEVQFDQAGRVVDLLFLEVNPAFAAQTGLADAAGKLLKTISPNHEQHRMDAYGEVARNGQPLRLMDYSKALGRWFDITAFRVGAPGQNRVAVLFEDVSKRRQADLMLQQNAERLRFLDELNRETSRVQEPDAILGITTRMVGEHLGVSICAYADMDADEDGFTILGDWSAPGSPSIVGQYRLKDFGQKALTELGAGRPLILKNVDDELPPHEAATFASIGIAATICMPLIREGRLTALMAIHDKAPRDWTPNELAMIGEVTERSWAHIERARTMAVVKASENQFRTMAQAMPNHVWTASADGLLDFFNQQVYDYSGAKKGALDGTGWIMMVHPDDVDSAGEAWAKSVETGETYQTEFRLRNANGQWRWHIARAVPVCDEAGQVVRWIGTNTDIDDQKNSETLLEQRLQERSQELALSEEALRQSQKMEAVGQLTGGIAHDFNNLLQGITGALDRVQNRISQGRHNDVDRFLKAAVESANRAAALTHRLLAFSRRQTLDPKPTDANRLIAGMEELVRRTMGPNVQVEVVGAGGLWPVRVDPSQLENSLLNLCINARDAMPEGGKLTIETANKWLDERAARDRELPPGQYVS
ncbi:MAG: PAS domain-containing protein, partial [Pseudomonadota bacterium]